MTWAGRFTADIEEIRALVHEAARLCRGANRIAVQAVTGKRVVGQIEDAHDDRPASPLEAPATPNGLSYHASFLPYRGPGIPYRDSTTSAMIRPPAWIIPGGCG